MRISFDSPPGGRSRVELVAKWLTNLTIKEKHMTSELTGVIAEHIKASNEFDRATMIATFADNALVNDARREFWGIESITRWLDKEMIGDHVTIEVTEVVEHYGETIVRGRYDGTYDKINLPDELIMTNYFTVRDDKIVQLIVIRNSPAPY